MAPKKSTASSSTASADPLLTSTNFIVGARIVTKDLSAKPYSQTVIDWLNMCNLMDLCTFSVAQYSLQVIDEFHKNRKVTISSGKLQGNLRNYELIINARTVGRVFGLKYNSQLPTQITEEEMKEAWDIMRLAVPMIGSSYLRKEFSPEVYLLSEIVDKVLMCKTGNKDKFTEEQLCIMTAIVLRKDLNWVGLLHNQIK